MIRPFPKPRPYFIHKAWAASKEEAYDDSGRIYMYGRDCAGSGY
jgi:hypothetical protein